MSDCIVEISDGVMLVRFNRPERMNAMGGTLLAEMSEAFRQVRGDDRIRAAVVTGEGRAWCAGADLVAGGGDESAIGRRAIRLDPIGSPASMLDVYRCDKPTIAAVSGACVGGGFGLACGFDIRIASEEARFSTVFIKRALAPDFGLSWFLPRMVGQEHAAEMFFSGRMVGAAEALELGIVSRVVAPDRLVAEAMEVAASFAKQPPMAMTLTKRALQHAASASLLEHLEYEWANQKNCTSSAEFGEALSAFRDKREPNFARF